MASASVCLEPHERGRSVGRAFFTEPKPLPRGHLPCGPLPCGHLPCRHCLVSASSLPVCHHWSKSAWTPKPGRHCWRLSHGLSHGSRSWWKPIVSLTKSTRAVFTRMWRPYLCVSAAGTCCVKRANSAWKTVPVQKLHREGSVLSNGRETGR